jgi:hypothetical protein
MPRELRAEYQGAMYRVMSRGDRGETVVQGTEPKLPKQMAQPR